MSVDAANGGLSHRIRLGDTRWWVDREFLLRSAGFPAVQVTRLGDPELAAAAVADMSTADFAGCYRASVARLAGVVREFVADRRLREAVAWQNPVVLHQVLDKLRSDTDMGPRRYRGRLATLASYLQRYTTKNDTIGFFGPAVWGWFDPAVQGMVLRPGPELLSERSVYFEWWAVDALAVALSEDPGVRPWLCPTLAEDWSVRDGVARGSHGRSTVTDPLDLALLRRCDGVRTVRELCAQWPDVDVAGRIDALVDTGALVVDLTGPIETRGEDTLRQKVSRIGDDTVRARLLGAVDEILAGRDAVTDAAGDPDRLVVALGQLNETFERITGTGSSRRPGETYAGRTLVYEDTTRDLGIRVGADVLRVIAAPLGLVLDSVAWLAGMAAQRYSARLMTIWERCARRFGRPEVPLTVLVGAATPDLAFGRRSLAPWVEELSAELRELWRRVLAVPPGVRRYTVTAADVAPRVGEAFPTLPTPWSSAHNHAPDLLIDATDVEAVSRGEFLAVLGEIHAASNSMDCRPFTERHPRQARLLAAAEAVHAGRRIVPIPSRYSDQVTSRTYPPVLLSPHYGYWTMYANTTGAPGPVTPAADLVVRRDDGGLAVHNLRTGAVNDLLEVIGEYLSGSIMNAFGISAFTEGHQPRLAIDQLVLAREAWSLPFADLAWTRVHDEAARYRAVCRWRTQLGMPTRVFCTVDGEVKPMLVDFTSPGLVGAVVTAIRRETRAYPHGRVTFSEMLPDLDGCWLPDAAGRRYTSEIRMLCTAVEE